jgi:alanine dehydrogenase
MEIVKKADILVKVKEPLSEEYKLLDNFKGKILFTYLHLSGAPKELTEKLLENNITGIAYETVTEEKISLPSLREINHVSLPLLKPMSEIAGALAIQYGAQFLQKKYHGKGITLSRIENTKTPKVVIIGGGTVGAKAALTALAFGANVTLLELREERIQELKEEFSRLVGENLFRNITFLKSTEENIAKEVKRADLLIGAVLVPGARAPIVVKREIVKEMENGSVIVDVAIDQGGCIYGSKPTSHEEPIFELEGKIFCCIPNMPGQVPLKSTQALTSATLPYIIRLANKGIDALREDLGFAQGLNTYEGKITCKRVAEDLGMEDKFISINKI